MAEEKDKLLDHNSDGIQEYDNDLPLWWRNIFIVTGVFAVIYVVYTHGIADTPHARLSKDLSQLESKRQAAATVTSGNGAPKDLKTLVSDQATLGKGKDLYAANCVACHGTLGEGLVGPNLTDPNWINGGDLPSIQRVINEGVPEKGMIPWKSMFAPDQIDALTIYVWSLHGTNPPNPKAPEGEVYQR